MLAVMGEAGPRVLVCACVLVLIYINKQLTQTTRVGSAQGQWTGHCTLSVRDLMQTDEDRNGAPRACMQQSH